MVRLLYFLVCVFLLAGCFPYKVSTDYFVPECSCSNCEMRHQASQHWLYAVIPRHRCQIRWYDLGHWTTWMLFGNDDDGIFGEEPTAKFRPTMPISLGKSVAWNFRNPLHNFCFYVIGTAYCDNSEFVILETTPQKVKALKYYDYATTNFASEDSSFFLGLHGWKPFISARLRYSDRYSSDFYLGWRCRGNFGIKFLPICKHKIEEVDS